MKYLALSLFMCFGIAGTASAERYECNLKESSRYHLIASKIFFEVAPDGGSAQIVDGILAYYEQSPATANKVVKRGNTLRVEWRLQQKKGTSINIHYSLKYRLDTGKVHVSASLPSFDNDGRAVGTCHVI